MRFDPELSRLAFEDRLVEFCEDRGVPLLERVRLLAIISDRLDVFFMTRVGRLKRIAASGEMDAAAAEQAMAQQELVAVEAHRVMRRAYRLLDDLRPALETLGVRIEPWDALDDRDRAGVNQSCEAKLAELVRPAVVAPGQMFPHVRNLRPALLAEVTRRADGVQCLAVVELPAELPRLVPLADGRRFVPLEQVIASQLPGACPDLDVGAAYPFRVTRNGNTDFSGEDDVMESVEEEVVWRPFQDVVRLEVDESMPDEIRERLLAELQREAGTPGPGPAQRDTYVAGGLIDLTALHAIADLDLPQHKAPPLVRRATRIDHLLDTPAPDALLHFPFDDYESSIERLLARAAEHPLLESMRTTIYRTDEDSDVVAALLAARKRGADVTAVVELKASFDEQENIEWARFLQSAGVRVVLSPSEFKVHAKTALVTFREGHAPRRLALVGTGNMNAVTSRAYLDLWLATADEGITTELAALFDVLVGAPPTVEFRHVLAAPFNMRRRFLGLIEREARHAAAGRPCGIRAMLNGLTDSRIIAALHAASQAGVPVDLVVRGVCLLRPGVPGISDNIRVVSVAGLLLQHARIFHFVNGGDDDWFIGSADWRPRNFDHRVELIAPVRDAEHRRRLDRILTDTAAAPDAWVLGDDGVYVRRRGARHAAAAVSLAS